MKDHSVGAIVVPLFCTLLLMGALYFYTQAPRQGGTTGNQPAFIATSSNPTVDTTARLLFATSSCTARTITTYASPVMLTFTDNPGRVPSAIYGHLQAASTTVVYDATQVGCGAVRIYSFTSQAITVSEAR